jgi:hypothetical protein
VSACYANWLFTFAVIPAKIRPAMNNEEIISAKLEAISKGLETVQTKVENQKPKDNWRTIVTQVIGIPAALLLLWVQFHQATNTPMETKKLTAETRKLELEADALQAGQDLKTVLNQAVGSGKDVATYRQQLSEASGKLNSVLEQLQQVRQNERLNSTEGLIARYLVIYVFFFVISLFFRTINTVWYPFINIAQATLFSNKDGHPPGRKKETLRKFVRTFSPILYPLPSIAEIAVDLLIVVAVLVPLFDLTASSLGHNTKFVTVYHELRGAHIGNAINLIRQIVAGG